MSGLKFSKYHGAGNDFVIVDVRDVQIDLSREAVARICHRRFGVGADGLMTLENDPSGEEFYMRYWNADGGESTMCGNGGRCISLFAHHLGIGSTIKHFNSSDGYHSAAIIESDTTRGVVELGMIDVAEVKSYDDGSYFAFTGSPHYVEFVDDVMTVNVVERGREIRNSARFADIGGTNVNFVQVLSEGHLRIRTFERGVEDETLACGTGATAAAIIASYSRQPNECEFAIEVMGGQLTVSFENSGEKYRKIRLSGPAQKVFDGFFL